MVKKLDEGGFGSVYSVENAKGEKAALKAEPNDVEGGAAIKLELVVLELLNEGGTQRPHVPFVYKAAKKPKYSYIIMTLLGDNLKTLKVGG